MSNIIFGPVNSRRFGKSLGVDLSPNIKQCNYDCLYCELEAAHTTDIQSDITPLKSIMNEIETALVKYKDIDVITLTANGEPTLYPHLEELVKFLHTKKQKKLMLTNAATITDPKICHILNNLDCVKLSLDCVSRKCFKKLDRPSKTIEIDAMIEAMIQFSKSYKGELLIEILFVKGINDNENEIALLNETLLKIDATRIDIGTVDRPPAYKVQALTYEELFKISKQFDVTLPINIASRGKQIPTPQHYSNDEILNTLSKRPLTPQDIEILLDEKSKERLRILVKNNIISLQDNFFQITHK